MMRAISASRGATAPCASGRTPTACRAPQALPVPSRRRVCVSASASEPAAPSSSGANLVRQVLTGVVSSIYKVTAATSQVDPRLSPLWQAIMKLDKSAVEAALASGGDANERMPGSTDTPLLYIARAGHYKYPPAEIPLALVKGGADMEAKDASGKTALEVSLLAGWQNISELLLKNGASTAGVAGIKSALTCPDCKRLVAEYQL